jgi:segregation and condensation protein A
VADAPEPDVVVARFLALLELFREGLVGFDQVTPLGELTVRWAGGEDDAGAARAASEFDEIEEIDESAAATPAGAKEVPA